ncbi:hypothetical protein [Candidatus Anaplasma sp. TIGMIC]|uniref:hypothetical protein n=1 Tax=Candidatus Anaplasma sp. TIGMIC TaxID=3020713 RepID=UPI002331427F|nr:hypothetical protein [Candidatus Anaplasma sp. TIGMIC]MDB1135064.1 hypothetical protein [Candidatus Anaplasma sp. TIGMIC]
MSLYNAHVGLSALSQNRALNALPVIAAFALAMSLASSLRMLRLVAHIWVRAASVLGISLGYVGSAGKIIARSTKSLLHFLIKQLERRFRRRLYGSSSSYRAKDKHENTSGFRGLLVFLSASLGTLLIITLGIVATVFSAIVITTLTVTGFMFTTALFALSCAAGLYQHLRPLRTNEVSGSALSKCFATPIDFITKVAAGIVSGTALALLMLPPVAFVAFIPVAAAFVAPVLAYKAYTKRTLADLLLNESTESCVRNVCYSLNLDKFEHSFGEIVATKQPRPISTLLGSAVESIPSVESLFSLR